MWIAVKAFLSGVSGRTWAIIVGIGLVALLAFMIYRGFVNYGDARENDGVLKERAAWEEADRKLQIKVAKAQTEATLNAAIREERHAAGVAHEREKIDEAVSEGRSPFDVLFGS